MNFIQLISGLMLYLNSAVPQTEVKFEKIIFHTSFCNGNCPVYHLEVDKDSSYKLYAETIFDNNAGRLFVRDTSKIGYYRGKVGVENYSELINVLNTVGLNDLAFDNVTCCDASVKEIIVYYNGKRKSLISMSPPATARNLILLLYKICDEGLNGQKTTPFEIEREKRE